MATVFRSTHLSGFVRSVSIFFYVFVANTGYNIIMASMDRYLGSSRDALRLIIINFVIGYLIYLQVIGFFEVTNGKCGPRLGTCVIVF